MKSDDKTEIIGVVNLYALAVDTRSWDLFDQAFVPGVQADFGGGAEWRDLASFKRDFASIHAPFTSTQHVTTNHVVALKGDTAHCVSYVHGRFMRAVPGGNMFESSGWYDDRFTRTEAGWRIAQRVCRMVWWGGNPLVLQTTESVPVEHKLLSLADEARAGRIGYLRALAGI